MSRRGQRSRCARTSSGRRARCSLARPPEAAPGDQPTGPVVTAPVQVNGRLAGMVVLPPPPPRGFLANVGGLLSLPGTLVLFAVTAIAALVIFAPARNRLRALERAAERFGAGELEHARAGARARRDRARRHRLQPHGGRSGSSAPTRCGSPTGCDGRCSPTFRTSCARR